MKISIDERDISLMAMCTFIDTYMSSETKYTDYLTSEQVARIQNVVGILMPLKDDIEANESVKNTIIEILKKA